MKKWLSTSVFFSILTMASTCFALNVDLGAFFCDTPYVVVDQNTGTVTFNETPDYAVIFFYNDNFFVPANADKLTYTYSLTTGPGDHDWLLTAINFTDYVMEIENTGSGTWSVDLTPYRGQTISLEFSLLADWDDGSFTSVGKLSNFEVATTVPLPGSFIFFGSGLIWLIKKRKNIS